MEHSEIEISTKYDQIQLQLQALVLQTASDLAGQELLSEKLTDLYLTNHQFNILSQSSFQNNDLDQKIANFISQANQNSLKYTENEKNCKEFETITKKSRSTIVAQLKTEHEKALLSLDNTKKQIDDHFKLELKSLSKAFS